MTDLRDLAIQAHNPSPRYVVSKNRDLNIVYASKQYFSDDKVSTTR